MSERSLVPSVAPELVVTFDGAGRTLRAALYRVVRDPEADLVVTDPRVSWNHAVLRAEGDVWFVEDCGSRNGTFVGSDRVDRFEIDGECTVRLGSADDGPALICLVSPPRPLPGWPTDRTSHPSRVDVGPTLVLPAPTRTLRIGRAEDNDVRVDDLSVSRQHAELRNTGDGYEIVDLGSRNGTFLNGSPVLRALVTEQDLVGIGPATFRLVGDELREFLDQGDVSLVARDLVGADHPLDRAGRADGGTSAAPVGAETNHRRRDPRAVGVCRGRVDRQPQCLPASGRHYGPALGPHAVRLAARRRRSAGADGGVCTGRLVAAYPDQSRPHPALLTRRQAPGPVRRSPRLGWEGH
jgi:pSer/pThr/pTyr-binding forkhead associated (FHA) protein